MTEHLKKTIEEYPDMKDNAISFFEVIDREDDPWVVAQVYGAYRQSGHPYINYLKGLEKLEKRVNEDIRIDQKYANILASDLAFLVLSDQFHRHKIWFATSKGLPSNGALKSCIDNNVWPTPKVIEDYGDKWHELDLLPCFEIPDTIDLSNLFSDKAHSLQRSEVLEHVRTYPHRPIPALRVMETLLKKENINIPKFLQEQNDNGLVGEDCMIGLKAKERELKDEGRFLALMTWQVLLSLQNTL